MLAFTLLALTVLPQEMSSKDNADDLPQGGRYGKVERLSGVYFTNFENSAFIECAGASCQRWTIKQGYNVQCAPAVCEDLDHRIGTLNGSPENWGTFAVTFEGRRSIRRHKPSSLSDRGQNLFVTRIVSFKLLKGTPS